MQSLTDAVLYVWEYPFGCNEQLASKMLGVVCLEDVLEAFHVAQLPRRAEIKKFVAHGLKTLKDRQIAGPSKSMAGKLGGLFGGKKKQSSGRLPEQENVPGSFGFWGNTTEATNAFNTCYMLLTVAICQEKGHSIPGTLLKGLLGGKHWVAKLDQAVGELREVGRSQAYLFADSDHTLAVAALALFSRWRYEPRPEIRDAALALQRDHAMDEVPMEALGWILAVLGDDSERTRRTAPRSEAHSAAAGEVGRYLSDHVVMDDADSGVGYYDSYYDDMVRHALLHSNTRTDAAILDGLCAGYPESPVIPQLVRGLLEKRRDGCWQNTQENAWAVMALDRYFRVFEKADPDFVARMWLRDEFCGEARFQGRSTETKVLRLPMHVVQGLPEGQEEDLGEEAKEAKKDAVTAAASDTTSPRTPANLLMQKDGPGRLYYRLALTYAPDVLAVEPRGNGFTVERSYLGMERDSDDVYRVPTGATVRVRVTMTPTRTRHHVAFVDRIPAGFEIVNKATQRVKTEDTTADERPPVVQEWWDHRNIRDDRVEVFAAEVKATRYLLEFEMRATTEGEFNVPPASAEEMYRPDVFGAGRSDRVSIYASEES